MRRTLRIVYMAVAVAVAMILSYIETLIPLNIGIPGAKLGLANAAVAAVLYMFGDKPAICVSAVRVTLSAVLFGTVLSFLYSITGAVLSLIGMILLKKTGKFGIVGVSAAGGVLHNMGQIAVALCVTETMGILYYIPLLVVAGVVAGVCMGILSAAIIKRMPHGILSAYDVLDKKKDLL